MSTTRKRASRVVQTSGGMKDLSMVRNNEAYFLALNGPDFCEESLPYISDKWVLVALNYLLKGGNKLDQQRIDGLRLFAEHGKLIYLDSGCFSHSMSHAKLLGCSPNEVFMTSPSQLPFFEDWYAVYIDIVPQVIDSLWGVVEIDYGSAAERAATRERIYNDCGIRPIPAFRFNFDPLEVFEELVRTHDRVCLAGLAMMPSATRSIVMPMLREIHARVNPDCWIHALGVSACGSFCGSGFASCDASTYTSMARYGSTAGYTPFGSMANVTWCKKFPQGNAEDPNLACRLGMFQHSTMNMGRVRHCNELQEYYSV